MSVQLRLLHELGDGVRRLQTLDAPKDKRTASQTCDGAIFRALYYLQYEKTYPTEIPERDTWLAGSDCDSHTVRTVLGALASVFTLGLVPLDTRDYRLIPPPADTSSLFWLLNRLIAECQGPCPTTAAVASRTSDMVARWIEQSPDSKIVAPPGDSMPALYWSPTPAFVYRIWQIIRDDTRELSDIPTNTLKRILLDAHARAVACSSLPLPTRLWLVRAAADGLPAALLAPINGAPRWPPSQTVDTKTPSTQVPDARGLPPFDQQMSGEQLAEWITCCRQELTRPGVAITEAIIPRAVFAPIDRWPGDLDFRLVGKAGMLGPRPRPSDYGPPRAALARVRWLMDLALQACTAVQANTTWSKVVERHAYHVALANQWAATVAFPAIALIERALDKQDAQLGIAQRRERVQAAWVDLGLVPELCTPRVWIPLVTAQVADAASRTAANALDMAILSWSAAFHLDRYTTLEQLCRCVYLFIDRMASSDGRKTLMTNPALNDDWTLTVCTDGLADTSTCVLPVPSVQP